MTTSNKATLPLDPNDTTTLMHPARGLYWFGQAIRGSWADIDGRSIQACMESYADWMESVDCTTTTVADVLRHTHDDLCVCVSSDEFGPGGSWSEYAYGCIVCGAGSPR